MIPKQDRIRPRTVEDLERMYKFGKRNEEMRGLATKQEVDQVRRDIPNVSDLAKAEDVKKQIEEVGRKIPTSTSQLQNDSDFATTDDVKEVDDRFQHYPTTESVKNLIAEAQLGGDDSDIDLSGFASKDEVIVDLEQTQKSTESGGTNIWTATFGDGSKSTFEVKNGEKGEQGVQGIQGIQGEKGDKGDRGLQGIQGEKGDKGDRGADGKDGTNGTNGKDGVSATHSWNGTTLTITSASGTSSADLKGDKGDRGLQGIQGAQGIQGEKGEKGDKGDKGDPGTPADTSNFYTKAQVDALINQAISNLKKELEGSGSGDSGGSGDGGSGSGSGDSGSDSGGSGSGDVIEQDSIYSSTELFVQMDAAEGTTIACAVTWLCLDGDTPVDVADGNLRTPLHIRTYYPIQYVRIYPYNSNEYQGTYNMFATDVEGNNLSGSWKFMDNMNAWEFTPSGEIEYTDIYIQAEFVRDSDGATANYKVQFFKVEVKA